MFIEKKEEEIIRLSDERRNLIKLIKSAKPENAQKYMKRLEQINKRIEELINEKHYYL